MPSNPNSLLAFFDHLMTKNPKLLTILCSLTDEEFDEGLEGVLEQAADYLEKNASHLAQLGEEAISAFLVAHLSSPVLRAIQEAYSNGHMDITIEAAHTPPLRRRLCEAKIYNSPAYHVEGLKQLINRYTTGREGSGIVVEYVKSRGIKQLVAKVRAHMDSNKPCEQDGNSQDHQIRWAFTTRHQHSSGEFLHVLHLNCNLYRLGS